MDRLVAAKRALRARMRAALAAMSAFDRETRSALVGKQVLLMPAYMAAKKVLFFAALPDEVETRGLMAAALAGGKEVFLPRTHVESGTLTAHAVREIEHDLTPGAYGIFEPRDAGRVPVAALDLMLVPGLAFDARCRRLGRGKGFYDRFLADEECSAFRCGLTFDFQIAAEVPAGPRDVPLDAVVSETRVYTCQNR